MQREHAHELNRKRSQAEFAIGGFTNRGERGQQKFFRNFSTAPKMFAKFEQFFLQLRVGKFHPIALL